MMTIVFLFLFPASVSTGHTGARVSQSPRHKVTERGQEVLLSCDPISDHDYLYWYRQMPGQGPEFLIYFVKKDVTDRSGMPNDRFSATRSGGKNSNLTIQRAEPGDSAVYLCASSKATARHSHPLPAHKPHVLASPPSQNPRAEGWPCSPLVKGKKLIWDVRCAPNSGGQEITSEIPEQRPQMLK
uniref:Ig-like domain-containing protein n=1 Tax=Rousettus aegyptiacus TaxID=9407 RepID=A0A7J8D6T6_ROUAE|nr:hypothetical protein HJG63_008860 [Rousettus aegyptiacus]